MHVSYTMLVGGHIFSSSAFFYLYGVVVQGVVPVAGAGEVACPAVTRALTRAKNIVVV